MIIRYASDLHIDYNINIDPNKILQPWDDDKDHTLIIAGDINDGCKSFEFVKLMCDRFKYVIMVLGNHEYYFETFEGLADRYKEGMNRYNNFYLLDNKSIIIDDIKFIGSTLWTDFWNQRHSMKIAKKTMNDFHWIHKEDGKIFKPEDSVAEHHKSVRFIDRELSMQNDCCKVIVITHHLPHLSCVAARFIASNLNPAFVSDLDWLIKKHKIDYWIHGHTHDAVNDAAHGTRILCNPRGYSEGGSYRGFNSEAYIEV